MLRDMVSELQDSLESMSRRFISSRLSVGSLEEKINSDESPSEDDDEETVVAVSHGAVLKNEIVYPAIHVEKQNHEEPTVVASQVKKHVAKPVEPESESEYEEEEEEEVVEVKPVATQAKKPITKPVTPVESDCESEEEGPDVSVPEEEGEEEEEEEAELEEFTFKGKTYYKDDENNVYNDDGDLIGRKVGVNVVFNKK